MQCLIIGYGSIGKRHADVAKNLGCDVALITSQAIQNFLCYSTIEAALEKKSFDYIVIANPTYLHYDTLIRIIHSHYQGIVLVEKPLFSRSEKIPDHKLKKLLVTYNLRFHELLLNTKKILEREQLITFSVYVGQYLPDWRRSTDYRKSYSAKHEYGGGVLRDLSHELDYSLLLCGPCHSLTSYGGQFSDLQIDSDDVYSILMQCEFCPIVNIQLNYLDRCARREISINTQKKTLFIDFIKEILSVDGKVIFKSQNGMQESYINQHQSILNQDFELFCDAQQGIKIVELIEKIEHTSLSKAWMNL